MNSPHDIYGGTSSVVSAALHKQHDETWYYTISINGINVLRSARTFLKNNEACIEIEWLFQKLGCINVRIRHDKSPCD